MKTKEMAKGRPAIKKSMKKGDPAKGQLKPKEEENVCAPPEAVVSEQCCCEEACCC